MNDKDGEYLVRLARKAVKTYIEEGIKIFPDRTDGVLGDRRGVFVTLRKYPDNSLRGCIGYPRPVKPLAEAVVDNALSAAFNDPRFPQVTASELDSITFEVTVLSVPEQIRVKDPSEYQKYIKIGTDGLIIEYGYRTGLLLPQVPIEFNWTPTEFLSNLCIKAGLPKSMWKSPNVKIYKFSGEIFEEEKPNGTVKRRRLIL